MTHDPKRPVRAQVSVFQEAGAFYVKLRQTDSESTHDTVLGPFPTLDLASRMATEVQNEMLCAGGVPTGGTA